MSDTKAEALLEAHVEFVVERLQGKALAQWLEDTLPPTMEDLKALRLDQFVPPRSVKAGVAAVMKQLVVDPALCGTVQNIAVAVLESEVHEESTFEDLLPDAVFEAGRDKAVSMRALRESVVRALMRGQAYRNFVSDLLYHGIRGWLADNPLTQNVPGAKAAMALGRSVLQRARLDNTVDERLHEYLDKSVHATAAAGERYALGIDEQQLSRGADAIWQRIRKASVADALAEITTGDAEDWAGIVYDGVHHLRGTRYLVALIDAGVDAFYADFGKRSVYELLEVLGITPKIIAQEISRHVDPAVKQLKKQKLLHDAVRRQLAPFYQSDACASVLAE